MAESVSILMQLGLGLVDVEELGFPHPSPFIQFPTAADSENLSDAVFSNVGFGYLRKFAEFSSSIGCNANPSLTVVKFYEGSFDELKAIQ